VNEKTTIVAKRLADGTLVQILPDGAVRTLTDDTDRLRAMTDEQIGAAALGDPDNPPLTDERLRRMRPVPRVRIIRRALGLDRAEFASRFRIPLETIAAWEEGRAEPDAPARAYLAIIARDAEAVRRLLKQSPA